MPLTAWQTVYTSHALSPSAASSPLSLFQIVRRSLPSRGTRSSTEARGILWQLYRNLTSVRKDEKEFALMIRPHLSFAIDHPRGERISRMLHFEKRAVTSTSSGESFFFFFISSFLQVSSFDTGNRRLNLTCRNASECCVTAGGAARKEPVHFWPSSTI